VSSHWVECLLDYIRALNCTIRDPEVVMEVGDESYRKVDTLLDSAKAPLIGLHVGKGIPLDENRWPVQFFARLADAVAGHFGGTLILTGDSREKRLVDQVESLMERRALNMAGKTSLKELAALVSRCRAFICPDSAPGHIAAAMKVPTVALFALKSDFPERWKPYGTSCAVVRPESIECSRKCIKEYCPQFRCYEQISTDQVLSALEGLLNESAQEREKLQE
jgi:ADP-heptose:LPS heptosyltransferase